MCLFFFKQKTAYAMRISGWSSDVCSSDLILVVEIRAAERAHEEIVAQGEVARDLPQPEVGSIVAIMPHHQRAAVSPGDEAVVAPAVDLQLIVVESVDQIAGDDAVRQGIATHGRASCREGVWQYV